MRNSMTQQRRFTKELRKKRSAWCKPAVERSARSPVIWDWLIDAGPLDRAEPGSARCRPGGSEERCHGRAEAAAPGERDPCQERDILKKATAFFAREGSR